MKNLFFLLLFLPGICLSQVNVENMDSSSVGLQDSILGTSFILKDHSVIFQKVYDSDLNKDELISELKSFLPLVKNFQLAVSPSQNPEQFTGRISDFMVNYKKFGGSDGLSASILSLPLSANVAVQVKDKRYRVTITEIIFKGHGTTPPDAIVNRPFDDFISSNHRTKVRTGRNLRIAKLIDKDLATSFDIIADNQVSTKF